MNPYSNPRANGVVHKIARQLNHNGAADQIIHNPNEFL